MRQGPGALRRTAIWLVLFCALGLRSEAARADAAGRDPLVEMEVADILSASASSTVVVLKSRRGETFLPIRIGEAEGLAIALRLSGRQAPRPLTHDLLEQVIRSLRARLVKVHIEAIRDSVFLGRIYLRQGGRQLSLDARPSDSIALALGARAPIYAQRSVLRQAGVSRGQLPYPPSQSGAPGRPDDGHDTRAPRGPSL